MAERADKPQVYVETSVLSLLVARRSADVLIAARQTLTRAWWRRRSMFDLVASPIVHDEAAAGDPREAAKRLAVLHVLRPLPVTDQAARYAKEMVERGLLPAKAQQDAYHLAVSMVHQIEFLATWNFKHLLNPAILRQMGRWASQNGYNMPVVCSPEALLRYEP